MKRRRSSHGRVRSRAVQNEYKESEEEDKRVTGT